MALPFWILSIQASVGCNLPGSGLGQIRNGYNAAIAIRRLGCRPGGRRKDTEAFGASSKATQRPVLSSTLPGGRACTAVNSACSRRTGQANCSQASLSCAYRAAAEKTKDGAANSAAWSALLALVCANHNVRGLDDRMSFHAFL
jgi:hypothetical protein